MNDESASDTPQIYLTAGEAYPAMERLFLSAKSEISAGFRVFDVATRLRSPEGRAVGDSWADLLAHTLARGVTFRLILTDFDPVVCPGAHRMTWESVARLNATAKESGRPDLMTLIPALHPARLGWLPRALLWPKIASEVRHEAERLNGLREAEAETDLTHMPGFRRYLTGEHPKLRAKRWPVPQLVPATHHQKMAVFDRERLFIGGLDLNERRYDTPEHDRPGEQTWHDMQVVVGATEAEEAHRHLDDLIGVTGGRRKLSGARHLLRTVSAKRTRNWARMSPRSVETTLEAAHLRRSGQSRKLIYLESQFFRSVPLAKALVRAARANPDLTLLLVLPGAPEDVAYEHTRKNDARYGEYLQAKCVQMVTDAFGERSFVMAPAQPKNVGHHGRETLDGAPLVYLHAKVSIFDDEAAIISSANLNGRSLQWDTEGGVTFRDTKIVRDIRDRCFRHWLPEDTQEAALAPETAVSAWRRLAEENDAREPEERVGFLMPYRLSPARRFGRNLPGVPEEMV